MRESTRNDSGWKKSYFGLNWTQGTWRKKNRANQSTLYPRGQIGKWTRGCRQWYHTRDIADYIYRCMCDTHRFRLLAPKVMYTHLHTVRTPSRVSTAARYYVAFRYSERVPFLCARTTLHSHARTTSCDYLPFGRLWRKTNSLIC